MSTRPRVLLVGAGAVGQVFGRYLQEAGCDVSFLVKERYAEEARRGFTLHELGLFQRASAPGVFSGFDVLVSHQEVAARGWDQVWLCVSSTALRAGNWVDALARATGEATWVMLQPSLDDRDWLLQWIPPERLVSGMIPFISFHAPLKPGERYAKPGTAFWLPPMTRGPFSGPPER
ncbi:MAG TPA: 2-dehydropantoate 2-reductase N-terminal domain-containing protein, partial [Myxococcaceae bacterium]|nr:2-dehydropantoate 2-reductase N-terminal domain-containing protein [Myxococcaceae bacterium]